MEERIHTTHRCSDCKADLRFGYTCDSCGSEEAELKPFKREYKCPSVLGYQKVRIPKNVARKLLPYRKWNLFQKQVWWINEDSVIVHFYETFFAKIIVALLFPYYGLVEGFFNKDLYRQYKRAFFQQKYGSYSSDKVWKSRDVDFYNTVLQHSPLLPIRGI